MPKQPFNALPSRRAVVAGAGVALLPIAVGPARAATATELDHDADAALTRLYAQSAKAKELGQRARAVLIFPKIVKAGLVIGGQGGEGVLRQDGKTTGYYRIAAVSYGLQAGAQTFGFVLFFISKSALDYLEKSNGWAVGSGPSVVVLDKGKARTSNTTTLSQDVYAMPFGQKGLMAGIGIEGSKITRFQPEA